MMFVRDLIARRGLTETIEAFARDHVRIQAMDDDLYTGPAYPSDDVPDYVWLDDGEYEADLFAESAEDYQRYYPDVWEESDANPEG